MLCITTFFFKDRRMKLSTYAEVSTAARKGNVKILYHTPKKVVYKIVGGCRDGTKCELANP